MTLLCIDRIEGDWAVCQDGEGRMLQVPLEELPLGAGEGDYLRLTAAGYQLDPQARAEAEQRVSQQLARLLGKKPPTNG